jgi:hypothetical protein
MVSTNCCNTKCPYMVKNMNSQCVCALTACPFQTVGTLPSSTVVLQQGETERRE